MSEQQYDIYFKGEALDGHDPAAVKTKIAQLFKASPEKTEQLFSGKVIALKKGLDKAGALKFKKAIEGAGAKIYIKAAQAAETQAPPKPRVEEVVAAPPPLPETSEPTDTPAQVASSGSPTEIPSGGLDILPTGSDVLTEDERSHVEDLDLDLSHIHMANAFDIPEDNSEPPPPAPDVSHITTAELGANLDPTEKTPPPPPPNTDFMTVADVGADLAELVKEMSPPVPVPDVDHISIAEVGADIDPTEKEAPPPAPDVSHIHLEG